MAKFDIVQGDLEKDLSVVLDVNGEAEDISDALAVEMRWLKPDGSLVSPGEALLWSARDEVVVWTPRPAPLFDACGLDAPRQIDILHQRGERRVERRHVG